MTVSALTAVGGLAAIASTASFVPQAVKIIRIRDTSGISGRMYVITVAGFALWTSYGLMQTAWPIIASNGICLMLSAFILAMKLLPPREKDAVADTVGEMIGIDSRETATAADHCQELIRRKAVRAQVGTKSCRE
jgi:MtN3 and saliva related transmembrane protein